jgi:cation diffusion facilitator CzcD-associated flavoprotein CzcO
VDPGVKKPPVVAIIGAGFAGLAMGARLKQAGFARFTIYERAEAVGGTWRENTYPGCACDVPSHLYSFSFAQNPDWTRAYSPQPEIQAYLEKCRDTLGLREHIRFGAEIAEMRFDEPTLGWRLSTSTGETIEADVVVNATGPLNRISIPAIPGLDGFEGTVFHSAQWRHDFDLTGKRVALIGTGASAIQIGPEIAPIVERLEVFQRTPPWVFPRADRAYWPLEKRLFRWLPGFQRMYRYGIYWLQELGGLLFLGSRTASRLAEKGARAYLRAQIADPALRARVTPDYAIGCKRILLSNDWYRTLQRGNVTLVSDGIAEIRPHAIATRDGREHPVDTIILATGFAATDFLAPMKVFGRTGVELSDAWKNGAATHLGISVAGFPNFFLLVGPNTGLGHNSIIFMIEAQVRWVLQAIRKLAGGSADALDLREDVQIASYGDVQTRMKSTVWQSGCRSWYQSADGRNDTLWPGFTFDYWRRTRRFDPGAYHILERAK